MTIRKCADCRFAIQSPKNDGDGAWDFAKCDHPNLTRDNNSNWHMGVEMTERHYCSTVRQSSHMCGKDAKLFEPRETTCD